MGKMAWFIYLFICLFFEILCSYLTLYPLPSGCQLKLLPLWSTRSSGQGSHILHSSTCSPAQLKSTHARHVEKITCMMYHPCLYFWDEAGITVFSYSWCVRRPQVCAWQALWESYCSRHVWGLRWMKGDSQGQSRGFSSPFQPERKFRTCWKYPAEFNVWVTVLRIVFQNNTLNICEDTDT